LQVSCRESLHLLVPSFPLPVLFFFHITGTEGQRRVPRSPLLPCFLPLSLYPPGYANFIPQHAAPPQFLFFFLSTFSPVSPWVDVRGGPPGSALFSFDQALFCKGFLNMFFVPLSLLLVDFSLLFFLIWAQCTEIYSSCPFLLFISRPRRAETFPSRILGVFFPQIFQTEPRTFLVTAFSSVTTD